MAVTHSKRLLVWKRRSCGDWVAVSQRCVARKCVQVRMCATRDTVLVADRSGDVYSFGLDDPEGSPGQRIVGRLSMVLDMVIGDEDSFVAVSGRDEKIQVSCFPNCYNIRTFCLGHTQFVTSLALLPGPPQLLVSGSGWTTKLRGQSQQECCPINPPRAAQSERGAPRRVGSCTASTSPPANKKAAGNRPSNGSPWSPSRQLWRVSWTGFRKCSCSPGMGPKPAGVGYRSWTFPAHRTTWRLTKTGSSGCCSAVQRLFSFFTARMGVAGSSDSRHRPKASLLGRGHFWKTPARHCMGTSKARRPVQPGTAVQAVVPQRAQLPRTEEAGPPKRARAAAAPLS
ncbi:uncharacterized protein LOC144138183 isoform X2 [Haemaphysalis longicornis]